ncbi:MAG: L-histidine N(alpha)-methyltransferase [Blastocatellia bacterium]|nr:L-histidine N(alpha)-methyltransferase [Blastocatellia bacterium]
MKAKRTSILLDLHPALTNITGEVLQGLTAQPKKLPPKLFYDDRGSQLFESICDLPEYYLTRTEIGILTSSAQEIAALLGPEVLLIEYGSGNSRKIRILLDALKHQAVGYVPIDISRESLADAASLILADYPKLKVAAICADYTQSVALPALPFTYRKPVVFFPGSTIGNFQPHEALAFLKSVAALLQKDGLLLIGVDLKKDARVLNAAYNDAQGVTAEFNLNLLRRLNREFQADFIVDNFRHLAFYNPHRNCIEMHLQSQFAQTVCIGGKKITFSPWETIHTEDSFKYSVDEFTQLASQAGMVPERIWTDPNEWFAVALFQVQ